MNYKHGLSHHPLYNIHNALITRCYDKKYPYFKNYGGRGIEVCPEWKYSPIVFIKWALNNGWKSGLYLDRINNNGNYESSNCRFVTSSISSCNRRLLKSTNKSGYRGVSKCKSGYIAQICKDGKFIHLGRFKSPRLAAIRYDIEAFLLNDSRPMNFILRSEDLL